MVITCRLATQTPQLWVLISPGNTQTPYRCLVEDGKVWGGAEVCQKLGQTVRWIVLRAVKAHCIHQLLQLATALQLHTGVLALGASFKDHPDRRLDEYYLTHFSYLVAGKFQEPHLQYLIAGTYRALHPCLMESYALPCQN